MIIAKTPEEVRDALKGTGTVGLVPTMGYLHDGHLSLVRRSVAENQTTAVSIFVNPTQFGPHEDLSRYPRDLKRDLELLEPLGVDLVFTPEPEAMYHRDHSTWVEEVNLARGLCGASRPGHFRGVCTVVLKLFNIVKPNRAYFGEKDYQQLKVIQRMVRDLNLDVQVVGCPIAREEDGLAMSSRNVYLSPEERSLALCLSRAVNRAQAEASRGVSDPASIVEAALSEIPDHPSITVDYIKLVDCDTLEELETLKSAGRILLAVRVGSTRLIDNGMVKPNGGV
ncbi:pantoate/beta-alanine ligase [Thermanaerovibrio acidaminovorans DSM 6589]|uniref:Pantothenate synthetase n=1 Tax=Thermanaerovibrio acidaminovorans (strain ATCC 49978 / DSM 6589 / Su883) TaxID=525903 RepID=D1B8U7_THEAS|nr:pantoate--beta-alanine ligase [Thermanaerovibrio acidaminovorans]ACZ18700.1 pantoate/beta-alanine ligase [Thermanaerovibrio acidaminovorans DSM 6589]